MRNIIVGEKQKIAVEHAFGLLPQHIQKYVKSLGDTEYLEEFMATVGHEVRPDVSEEGMKQSARDRLNAHILDRADHRGDTGIYQEVLANVRAIIEADGHALSNKKEYR